MTDSAERPQEAVNSQPVDPWREFAIDGHAGNYPDDEAERERWMRDNVPPHHG